MVSTSYGNELLKVNEHIKGTKLLAQGQGVIKFTQSNYKIF